MTLEEWRARGRPEWVVSAVEAAGDNIRGTLFYRTRQPLYKPLDLYAGFTEFTVEVRAGDLLKNGPGMVTVEVAPLLKVAPEREDLAKGWVSETRKPVLWDRSLMEAHAQKYGNEEDDPDYVPPE